MVIKESISTLNMCHREGSRTLPTLFKEAAIISTHRFEVLFFCFLHLFRRIIPSQPLGEI